MLTFMIVLFIALLLISTPIAIAVAVSRGLIPGRERAAENSEAVVLRQRHGNCCGAEDKITDIEWEQAHPVMRSIQDDTAANLKERRKVPHRVIASARQEKGGERGQKTVSGEKQHHAGNPADYKQRRRQVYTQQKNSIQFGPFAQKGRAQQGADVAMEAIGMPDRPTLNLFPPVVPGGRRLFVAFGAVDVGNLPSVDRQAQS